MDQRNSRIAVHDSGELDQQKQNSDNEKQNVEVFSPFPVIHFVFAFRPDSTATIFNRSFIFEALRRIAVCVRLSSLAMVAISLAANIDARSLLISSGVHERGDFISPSPSARARRVAGRPRGAKGLALSAA
jgi:hypothetical protein